MFEHVFNSYIRVRPQHTLADQHYHNPTPWQPWFDPQLKTTAFPCQAKAQTGAAAPRAVPA